MFLSSLLLGVIIRAVPEATNNVAGLVSDVENKGVLGMIHESCRRAIYGFPIDSVNNKDAYELKRENVVRKKKLELVNVIV